MHIYFSADGIEDDVVDPSFAEPEREVAVATNNVSNDPYHVGYHGVRSGENGYNNMHKREISGSTESVGQEDIEGNGDRSGGNEAMDKLATNNHHSGDVTRIELLEDNTNDTLSIHVNNSAVKNDTNQVKYTPMHTLSDEEDVDDDTNATDYSSIHNNMTETTEEELGSKNSTTLLEALQPVTYRQCCIPPISNKSPDDVACFGTCYNERACTDPNFPFSSAKEKAMFPMSDPTPFGNRQLRKLCQHPEKLTPPMKWCQQPFVIKNRTEAYLVDEIPPAGCSTTSNAGGSGAFQHVLLFPKHKLAFCGIPKVGITQWEQFLRFYIGAKDYPALPHYKIDREYLQLDKLDPSVQRRIWEDDEWTWAAFIRNPAERLLSAYLDKVVKTKKAREKPVNATSGGSMSFTSFIANLSMPFELGDNSSCKNGTNKGLSWCSDPHWRPQVYSCGMSERIDRMNFIGNLDNVADQTKELLSHVGMWDSYGKKFINGGENIGRSPWCNIVSHPFDHKIHVGFQQKDEISNSSAAQTVYRHAKGSASKMDAFYTPELLKKVQEELYPEDYKLWQLVNDNGSKLSRGKDLMSKLSSKC